jgi:hypothetical protein
LAELHILLEGEDDSRLFKRILLPIWKVEYNPVCIYEYSNEPDEWINDQIRGFNLRAVDFFFVADLDRTRCITQKKDELISRFPNLPAEKIVIVVKSIEAWYAAGLTKKGCTRLNVVIPDDPRPIGKAGLRKCMGTSCASLRDFKIEILGYYSLKLARKRSKSFQYFFSKYCC